MHFNILINAHQHSTLQLMRTKMKAIFSFLSVIVLLLPSCVHGEAQTDFTIKPNGKLSHTEANMVRQI